MLRGDKKVHNNYYIIFQLIPNGMIGEYDLNPFRKGIKLTKEYILSRKKGNAAYGQYAPDHVNPKKLTRWFLLTVIEIIYTFSL